MRSLRQKLTLGTALGTASVLIISGAILYALISRTLWAEFDASLAAKARSLAALIEQDHDRLDVELTAVSFPEFERSDDAEYYEIWVADGEVVARSRSLGNGELARIQGAVDAPAYQAVTLPDGRRGRIVGMTFAPRQEDDSVSTPPLQVTLVVGRTIAGLEQTLIPVGGLLVTVCVLAAVMSAGVLAWVVRRSLKPVDHLSEQITAVHANDLSTRIDVIGVPTELVPVVDCLNDLLARLHAAFQRERRFTGDVAHELRTPLAGLRTTLELALSRNRTPQTYREAMGDCLGISHEMQHMVENLLHLARADAGQLELRREAVDFPGLLRECWKVLEPEATARGLDIEWHFDGAGLIETDREKLRLVLQNILDNAATYADEGTCIRVAVTDQEGMRVLRVSNSASHLSTEAVPNVFDRFWRADSSCRGAEAHCGLGLPLCKAMIEKLGGTIDATLSADATFTITVCLPGATSTRRTQGVPS